jgi:membrane protein required for colicin V production
MPAVTPQDPAVPPPADDMMASLQHLGWVDVTALSVLGVFFILGLFKGAFWQVSRIAILLLAYVASGQAGPALGGVLHRWTTPDPAQTGPSDTSLYLAYVIVFVSVLIVLSLLALLLQRLVKRAGLGFYDRLGGGVLGVVTGACVVLFLLSVVHMFFPQSRAAEASSGSHSLRLSRQAIDTLGEVVPDPLRRVFALDPLGEPGNGPGPEQPRPAGGR